MRPLLGDGRSTLCEVSSPENGKTLQGLLFEPSRCLGCASALVYCPNENPRGLSAAEVLPIVQQFLLLKSAVFCLDTGNSLCDPGMVRAAVNHLRNCSRDYENIALWGRSSGAVAALRCGEMEPSLSAVVCDGAYCDLKSLWSLPGWMSHVSGLCRVAGGMSSATSIAPSAVEATPLDVVTRCSMPALFLHATEDETVPPIHGDTLQKAYGGEAQLVMVPGTHDTPRPLSVVARAVLFVVRAFEQDHIFTLVEPLRKLTALATERPVPATERVATLGSSEKQARTRRELFLGAVDVFSQQRRAFFHEVSLNNPRKCQGPFLHVFGHVVLPHVSCEGVVAWTMNGVGVDAQVGPVFFATISTTELTLTLVKCRRKAGTETTEVQPAVTTLALADAVLAPGTEKYELDLRVSYSGAFNLSVGSATVSVEHLYEEDFLNGACSEGRSDLIDSVSMWTAMCCHDPCDRAPSIVASGVVDGGKQFIAGEFREALDLTCLAPPTPHVTSHRSPSTDSIRTDNGYISPAIRRKCEQMDVTSHRSPSTDSIRTDNGYISAAIRRKCEQMDPPDGKASASKRSVAVPSVSVTSRGTQGAFSQRECDTLLSRSNLVTRTDGSLDLSRTNFSASFVGERFEPPLVNCDRDPSCDSLSPASNRTLPRYFGATRQQFEASPDPFPLATPVHVSDVATMSTMYGKEGSASFVGERFDSEPWPPLVNCDRDPSCDSLSPASNRTLPRSFGATRRQFEASTDPFPLATPVHVSDEATMSTMDGEEGTENTWQGHRSTWPGDAHVRRDVQNTWSPGEIC